MRSHTYTTFSCSRCGVPVSEVFGVCRDCWEVVTVLGEHARWRSEYSKEQRRNLMRRISVAMGATGRSAFAGDYPMPVRDKR
jgi:predicted ATP-dependent serine protease